MEGEREGEEANTELESDDEDGLIYNPLKLPIGWDGKPIPYWLYKLHGLGQVCSLFMRPLLYQRNIDSH
jgi:splicing factor 3A subunit 3